MDDKISVIQNLVKKNFDILKTAPEFSDKILGFTISLGKHYAYSEPRILMLGLNPGKVAVGEDAEIYQDKNCLLGDTETEIRYWRNARKCFGVSQELRNLMEYATFSFCSPFSTADWPSGALRLKLEELSRPILQQMLQDCKPSSVILAGKKTVSIFSRIADVSVKNHTTSGGSLSNGSWSKISCTSNWGDFDILQVPHFSRYNSNEGLKKCGEWLTSMLTNG